MGEAGSPREEARTVVRTEDEGGAIRRIEVEVEELG